MLPIGCSLKPVCVRGCGSRIALGLNRGEAEGLMDLLWCALAPGCRSPCSP